MEYWKVWRLFLMRRWILLFTLPLSEVPVGLTLWLKVQFSRSICCGWMMGCLSKPAVNVVSAWNYLDCWSFFFLQILEKAIYVITSVICTVTFCGLYSDVSFPCLWLVWKRKTLECHFMNFRLMNSHWNSKWEFLE